MNYYEELGVSQEATEQEIRKAHRRLVKLMHPDAQPDQNMKMLAETQMRRLNSIVSTLLDHEQRREYDDQLRANDAPYRHVSGEGSSWRGIPWWLASIAGAVVLTLLAVWVWADHLGSTFGNKSVRAVVIQQPEGQPSVRPASPIKDVNQTNPVGASYNPGNTGSPLPPTIADPPSTSGPISTKAVNDPPPVIPKAKPSLPPPPVEKPKEAAVVTKPAPPVIKVSAPAIEKPKTQLASRQEQPIKVVPAAPPAEVAKRQAAKADKVKAEKKSQVATIIQPAKPMALLNSKYVQPATTKRTFEMPASSLISQVLPASKPATALPSPPRVNTPAARDFNSATLAGGALPTAVPPAITPAATTPTTTVATTAADAGDVSVDRDPLEGEWVYAPKEPERRRAGFYPPEYIDLKLFGSGDPGSLKGEYSAKYVITDRPVSPEVTFELASVSKGSRRFNWQSNSGARGTMIIDPIDEHTIRVDWHTTSAIHGPALTSGQATLVRRR